MSYSTNSTYNKSLPFFPSESKKTANNFDLAKKMIDYYDTASSGSDERKCKIIENFNLYSGRWPEIENSSSGYSFQMKGEDIVMGGATLRHYPIIEKVAKTIVADLQATPLIPVIKDHSPSARTLKEKTQIERIRRYFVENVIEPHNQRTAQSYMQEMGIEDPISLSIEDQQKMRQDIAQRAEASLDEEVAAFMDRYRTPSEQIASQLMDFILRDQTVKDKFDTGAENAVVTGEEYYRVVTRNKRPVIDLLRPDKVQWFGSESVEHCEDGVFATYVDYITPEDFIAKHGMDIARRDLKNIEKHFSPIPGSGSYKSVRDEIDPVEGDLLDFVADNPGIDEGVEVMTREGQKWLKSMYGRIGRKSGHGIRECYVTWRWNRPIKIVERDINGVIETFFRDEHYRENPLAGDVKVTESVIPQVWHGTKYGDGEDWYIGIEPVPWQYNSLQNPFDVKLTIYGREYGGNQGLTKNTSHVDLGKPWQYRYDCMMRKLEEYESTDIGKVFVGTVNMIPDGWTWAEWFKSVFVGKMALVKTKGAAQNNFDSQIFKVVDMSRSQEIAATIQKTDYFENKIISAMHSSPAKFGQISEYATNQNAQASLQGTDRQNFSFAQKRRGVKNRVMNALLQAGLVALKENKELRDVVLDDFMKAHFELNVEEINTFALQVSVVDEFEEQQKVKQLRELALTMLQNGLSAKNLAQIMEADSVSEIVDIMDSVEKQNAKSKEAEFNRNMQMEQKRQETIAAQVQANNEFTALEAQRERELKMATTEIASKQMQLGNDVNEDKIPDSVQKEIIAAEVKKEIAKMNNETKIKIAEISKKDEPKVK